MNYKPDENILISYLYGDLDEKENAKVQQYFQEHPEEHQKLLGFANAREILGALKDKEVIAPPVFMDDHSHGIPIWRSSAFKTVMSIAASFLILMVAARVISLEINYSGGELRIGFGKKQEVPVQVIQPARLTSEEVQTMINSSLSRNNESIASNWSENQRKLDESIRQRLDLNSKRVDDIMKNASLASQAQVQEFVGGLQNENLRLMKDYLQLSSTEQKKYVENLLVDFSKYLQEQRNQDLNLFQTRISSVEKNTNQFKQETEQILTSIISNSGVTKKQNSY